MLATILNTSCINLIFIESIIAGFSGGLRKENRRTSSLLPEVVHLVGFPGGLEGKEFARDAGDLGLIPGLGFSHMCSDQQSSEYSRKTFCKLPELSQCGCLLYATLSC